MRKFRLQQSASGAEMVEDEFDGEWVSVDRVLPEIEKLKAAARRVIRCHDIGTLSKAPGDSISIEALRELVKE